MINETALILQPISKEQFDTIYNLLKREGLEYVSFSYENINGIFYSEKIIGLFKNKKFIDNNLSIDIAILSKYRGKGIAAITLDKIVKMYGKKHPEVNCFIANINPLNKIANKCLENSSWTRTHEYDELMINEGSEFFNIYYKNNPYYKKEKILLKK